MRSRAQMLLDHCTLRHYVLIERAALLGKPVVPLVAPWTAAVLLTLVSSPSNDSQAPSPQETREPYDRYPSGSCSVGVASRMIRDAGPLSCAASATGARHSA